jgi:small-conductance mechanosensitive channel
MALGIDSAPLHEFVQGLAGASPPEAWLWQLGVVGAALLLAWLIARALIGRVPASPHWKFGEGNFAAVAVPLIAWGFVALGRALLARHQPVALLNLVALLLVAWLVIRLAVYVLGLILPPGELLRTAIRAVAWIAWIGVALQATGLLPEVREAFGEIGISLGQDKPRITLLLVIQGLVALALTLTVAAWFARVTESRVLALDGMQMSTRVVITKFVRAATVFLAVLIALPMVGIDITALSIFSGALGVGLGIGLQKIASNYVSGFIVLLDRSVRIGDLIAVGTRRGEVKEIAARYTVIKASDGSEWIIPNETLITETVSHFSFTDPRVAVVLAVTIAYESDVDRACALLLEAARTLPRVLREPPAATRVKQLRDVGIDLELTFWIGDPLAGDSDLKSDIYKAVLKAFPAAGIAIPYPRQEVRLLATPETKETPLNSGV